MHTRFGRILSLIVLLVQLNLDGLATCPSVIGSSVQLAEMARALITICNVSSSATGAYRHEQTLGQCDTNALSNYR